MSYDIFTLVRLTEEAIRCGYYTERSDEPYEIRFHPEWLFFIVNFRYRLVLLLFLHGSTVVQFKSFIYGSRHSTSFTRIANYYNVHPIRAHSDENLYRYYDGPLRQNSNNGCNGLGSSQIGAY